MSMMMETDAPSALPGMQPVINLNALDDLVTQYLQHTTAVKSDIQNRTHSSQLHACYLVKHLVAEGDIRAATALIQAVFPDLLQDQRLVFRLKKQLFVEILKGCAPERDAQAIECARQDLAPLALVAYPEAYTEFKHILLLLVLGERRLDALQLLPPQRECSDAARHELAATLFHSLLAATGSSEPPLHLLLAYLCSLHSRLHSSTLGPAPPVMGAAEAAAAEELLEQGREAGPLPADTGGHWGPDPREDAVQALMGAVGLGRQAAVEALRRAGGLPLAARLELSRLRLREEALLPLLAEYAAFRGLAITSLADDRSTSHLAASCRPTEGDAADDVQRAHQARSSSRSPPTKIPRTRGPAPSAPAVAGAGAAATQVARPGPGIGGSGGGQCAEGQQSQALLASIAQAAEGGDVERVEAAVRSAAPGLLEGSPQLLFQLRRCRYVGLVEGGAAVAALHFARRQLAPLAAAAPQLQEELSATMASLVPGVASARGWATLPQVVAALQSAVTEHLGLRAPRLVGLLQGLLAAHRAWFQLQRCADVLADELQVNAVARLADPAGGAGGASAGGGDRGWAEAGPGEGPGGGREEGADEEVVLQLMMILEWSRAAVLDLLRANPGASLAELLLHATDDL